MERWVVSFKPRPLYGRGKIISYPANRSWVDSAAGLDVFEKKHFFL